MNYVLYFPFDKVRLFLIFQAVVYERNTSGRFGGLSPPDRRQLPFALLSNPTQTPLRNKIESIQILFSSTKYTFSPLFLDNIIFSLDILHGREAGRLHGPQVDLAELRQHAVEPAIEGLEGSLGP